jgi:hypothetical protein
LEAIRGRRARTLPHQIQDRFDVRGEVAALPAFVDAVRTGGD